VAVSRLAGQWRDAILRGHSCGNWTGGENGLTTDGPFNKSVHFTQEVAGHDNTHAHKNNIVQRVFRLVEDVDSRFAFGFGATPHLPTITEDWAAMLLAKSRILGQCRRKR
jgi:hypothetical protein